MGEDLHVNLTGWARPGVRGASSADEFIEGAACRPSKRLERIPPYLFAELERKIAESARRAST